MVEVPARLFDRRTQDRAFVPTTFRTATACSGGPGRPSGRRECALPWRAANPVARWRWIGIGVLLAALTPDGRASAQNLAPSSDLSVWVAEASARFAMPPSWITGVMRRESGFQPLAVSSTGALGLMQVMRSTYQDLRRRYGLGVDPLAPRDNILAGAAYLREQYDRFGQDGFLAAYNAGPSRYLRSLIDGGRLPAETRRYVDQLQLDLGLGRNAQAVSQPAPTLFAPLTAGGMETAARAGLTPRARQAGGLFAPISQEAGDAR